MKNILNIATKIGQDLHTSWLYVLETISKLDELRLINNTVKKEEQQKRIEENEYL